MSAESLRVLLEGAASFGTDEVRAFAAKALLVWDAASPNSERCRRYRTGQNGVVDRVVKHVATRSATRVSTPTDTVATVSDRVVDRVVKHVATVSDRVVGGRGALSGSHVFSGSPSLSGSPEPQRESACASAPPPARESSRAQTEEQPRKETQVTLTLAISDELTAIAGMCEVQDVKGAWLKFCGYYDGRGVNLAGKWQQWCVGEAKRERTERHRAATAPQPGAMRSKYTGLDYKGQPEGPHTPDNYNPNPISRAIPNRLPAPEYVASKEVSDAAFATINAALSGSPVMQSLVGSGPTKAPRRDAPTSMTEEQYVAERERQLAALAALNAAERERQVAALAALNGGSDHGS